MEGVIFKPMSESECGECEKCGCRDFGIDRFEGRVFVYCKQCCEEVLTCP